MILQKKPSINELNEIKDWLIFENENTGEGFFCNWDMIEKSFTTNLILVFQYESNNIGFITWNDFEDYVTIDIMEVHPNYRKKGIGGQFYKMTETYFKSKGYKAIKLFCSPEKSEKFWKNMGFIKFPDRGYNDPELTYYKPLIEVNNPINDNCIYKLELWDVEPIYAKRKEARWKWNLDNKKPILQPCNSNWNLRLSKNGEIIKEDKVKYFERSKEIYFGCFLYIDSI